MFWFDLLFPVFMLLFPAGFTLFVRRAEDVEAGGRTNQEHVQALSQRLWLGTASALIAYLVAFQFLAPSVTQYSWVLFFPLWFGLAQPVLQAKNPSWGSMHENQTQRSASLKPRVIENPVPVGAWVAAWGLWLTSVLVIAMAKPQSGLPGWVPWLIVSGGAFWLLFGPWGVRMFLQEAEPMDTSGSPELAAEYGRFRAFKAWGWYYASVLAMFLASATALLIAYLPHSELPIWIGAGGGSLLGVAGGVFGTYCSIRRVRIADLYRQLQAQDH